MKTIERKDGVWAIWRDKSIRQKVSEGRGAQNVGGSSSRHEGEAEGRCGYLDSSLA